MKIIKGGDRLSLNRYNTLIPYTAGLSINDCLTSGYSFYNATGIYLGNIRIR